MRVQPFSSLQIILSSLLVQCATQSVLANKLEAQLDCARTRRKPERVLCSSKSAGCGILTGDRDCRLSPTKLA